MVKENLLYLLRKRIKFSQSKKFIKDLPKHTKQILYYQGYYISPNGNIFSRKGKNGKNLYRKLKGYRKGNNIIVSMLSDTGEYHKRNVKDLVNIYFTPKIRCQN
jgi:hypothetical protein